MIVQEYRIVGVKIICKSPVNNCVVVFPLSLTRTEQVIKVIEAELHFLLPNAEF